MNWQHCPAIDDKLSQRILAFRQASGTNLPFPQLRMLSEAGVTANQIELIDPFIMLEPDANEPVYRIQLLPHTLASDDQPNSSSWRFDFKDAEWISISFKEFSVDASQPIEITREAGAPPVGIYGGELGPFRSRPIASDQAHLRWDRKSGSGGHFVIDRIIGYFPP